MKKIVFQVLNAINRAILPKYSKRNPEKLSKMQLAVLAFRYYVLINSKD